MAKVYLISKLYRGYGLSLYNIPKYPFGICFTKDQAEYEISKDPILMSIEEVDILPSVDENSKDYLKFIEDKKIKIKEKIELIKKKKDDSTCEISKLETELCKLA